MLHLFVLSHWHSSNRTAILSAIILSNFSYWTGFKIFNNCRILVIIHLNEKEEKVTFPSLIQLFLIVFVICKVANKCTKDCLFFFYLLSMIKMTSQVQLYAFLYQSDKVSELLINIINASQLSCICSSTFFIHPTIKKHQ